MRILLVGGGSGGHVTPLRAISQSIQQQTDKQHEITIITDRKFYPQTKQLFVDEPSIKLKKIYSGKFRRYHNKSILWHMTHLPTLLKNIRDIALLGIGFLQSILYFLLHKPDVVFCKGGFTCVPVGLVSHIFNVPLYIHDSDTIPGLTNRVLARFATKILTGMPIEYYPYDTKKLLYVGIPVDTSYKPAKGEAQLKAKKKLHLSRHKPLLLVTGGGTGAEKLSKIIALYAEDIVRGGWQIAHITGKGKSRFAMKKRELLSLDVQSDWKIEEFVELSPYVAAADLIISRAGATAMQEFANAKKSVVIIPSPYLTGGHQLKNAAMFLEKKAAVTFDERDLQKDAKPLLKYILKSPQEIRSRELMASNLYTLFARPAAASMIAKELLQSKKAKVS
jgi:UDP-N-acetylglucosamine--N-acetylmuramyl-(pentapeptide) pyrophosphoryl-undecaprenol N-acetylglucosamine transferase